MIYVESKKINNIILRTHISCSIFFYVVRLSKGVILWTVEERICTWVHFLFLKRKSNGNGINSPLSISTSTWIPHRNTSTRAPLSISSSFHYGSFLIRRRFLPLIQAFKHVFWRRKQKGAKRAASIASWAAKEVLIELKQSKKHKDGKHTWFGNVKFRRTKPKLFSLPSANPASDCLSGFEQEPKDFTSFEYYVNDGWERLSLDPTHNHQPPLDLHTLHHLNSYLMMQIQYLGLLDISSNCIINWF